MQVWKCRNLEDYWEIIERLDVSTSPHGAVFYADEKNRRRAEAFACKQGKQTLDMTEGGRWFLENIDNIVVTARPRQRAWQSQASPEKIASPSARNDAYVERLWQRLAERFALAASGHVVAFVERARLDCLFNRVQFPALVTNPNVRNIISSGF